MFREEQLNEQTYYRGVASSNVALQIEQHNVSIIHLENPQQDPS